MGCVYINPTYSSPMEEIYYSQNDYAEKEVGPPYVCSSSLGDREGVMKCVRGAVEGKQLVPLLPPQMAEEEYMKRLKKIFKDFLPPPPPPSVEAKNEG